MSETDDRGHQDAGAVGSALWTLTRQVVRNLLLDLAVAQPGTVVSYDPATQRARVTLGFRKVEDRTPEVADAPQELSGVRVCWPMTSTSYDTAPLLTGSTGIVLFLDRAMDVWYRQGGSVDPVDARAHSQADAVFLPLGLVPDSAVSPTDVTGRVIEAVLVKIGKNAADFTYKGTTINAVVAGLNTTLSAVPAASDPATVITLANANQVAILGLFSALLSNLTTKAQVE